jgi:probable F420-dependent oxidoreductase
MTMEFGIALPTSAHARPEYEEAGRLRAMAERAEELGFEGVWVCEHLLRAPLIYGVSFLSPLSVLAHVAARTRRIRLGTAVLILPLRNPVLLAKELATLDLLLEGRLVLGVGTGWDAREFEACGVPLRERAGRTDEGLSLLRRLLSEESVSFRGKHYDVRDVTIEPRPRRFPEVWIGGGSKMADPAAADKPVLAPSVLARIQREADVWIARPTDQSLILADLEQVRAACHSPEREGRPLKCAHFNFLHVVDTDDRDEALGAQRDVFGRVMGAHRPFDVLERCYLMGTPAEIVAKLARLGRAGFEYFILAPLVSDVGQVELIRSRIVAPLAGGRPEMEASTVGPSPQ